MSSPHDAPEADMAHSCVDHLWLARPRAITQTLRETRLIIGTFRSTIIILNTVKNCQNWQSLERLRDPTLNNGCDSLFRPHTNRFVRRVPNVTNTDVPKDAAREKVGVGNNWRERRPAADDLPQQDFFSNIVV
jgi:hypothetical protein